MTSAPQTTAIAGTTTLDTGPAALAAPRRGARVLPQHIALTAVLALSAVLNINHLSRNGYANTFYSAGVHSMLHSLHNFFFVSFDAGGMVTIDKPPFGLWVQGLSAALFGFHPLSLLLPEAIAGVLAVAALYWVVTPSFGPAAGVMSALALAVFPSFVAVSRDNNLDAILILLMVLACGVGLRAIGSGRLLTLLGCAALVGLAFNTKTLAAYLVVPGLGLGYLVCAPGSLARRAGQLLAAGIVLLLVSASWSLIVELTPASSRPFVGGSVDNTEYDLTFGYNGFGRVEGQVGGPGRIPVVFKHGSLAHIEREALRARATHGRVSVPGAAP
ncbi:MAG: glycosyltransferase family 39 protein, partial [Solirubrobacteraceae bacterium]